MSKALQDCPTSGLLWAQQIAMVPRPERKRKSIDAKKKCGSDPLFVLAVARMFWKDRNADKARKWFTRAVALQPSYGDAWAMFYKFEVRARRARARPARVPCAR